MSVRHGAVVGAAALYLVVLGWAMTALSYDIWGGLALAPVLAAVSAPLINVAFQGPLEGLRPVAWIGLAAKAVGAGVGYFVRFDAYGGSADAAGYHDAGRLLASDLRDGVAAPLVDLTSATGTQLIEHVVGVVYAVSGSSRFGGFLVFAWLSYWGLVFAVKALAVAVPSADLRRYALLVFLVPSLVYWGSSVGKEAVIGLFLGLATYGTALVLADHARLRAGTMFVLVGLVGTARIRPHFAAIWAGALVVGLLVRVVVRRRREVDGAELGVHGSGADGSRVTTALFAAMAGLGFVLIAATTLNYFDPANDVDPVAPVTDRLSSIFDEAERRTTQGGSNFDVAVINGPLDWPVAAVRTLTRPLLTEADSLAELLPAIEMTALLVFAAMQWRRVVGFVRAVPTTPYLVVVVLILATFGVAFATVGNLAILVRQRSLVLPMLMIVLCLPAWRPSVVTRFAHGRSAPSGVLQSRVDHPEKVGFR